MIALNSCKARLRLACIFFIAVWGVLLGVAWSTVAVAETVPASFDCKKASKTVEKFICSQAVLRWNDWALARSYRTVYDASKNDAREKLVFEQRDWIRERDRRCIADRTLPELLDTSAGVGKQAYDCLETVYLDRRRILQDTAVAPISLQNIMEMDLSSIRLARPEFAPDEDIRATKIELSPNGALAAIWLASFEVDGADQVWLYRFADRQLIPATPPPDQRVPHAEDSPLAVMAAVWQGSTLYTRVALQGKGDSEPGPSAVYEATEKGSRQLTTVPADIATLLDAMDEPSDVVPDEIAKEAESPMVVESSRSFDVWADDLGHGTIELKAWPRAAPPPSYRVAWGSWELMRYLFDKQRSQLIYPSGTGMMIFDLSTRRERRIAKTSVGDHPYAVAEDFSRLVWSTARACGDEFMEAKEEGVNTRLCFASLRKPEDNQ